MTLKKITETFTWEATIAIHDADGKAIGFEEVLGEVVVYAGDTEDGDYDWAFFEGANDRTGDLDDDDREEIMGEIEMRQIEREEEEQGPPEGSAA